MSMLGCYPPNSLETQLAIAATKAKAKRMIAAAKEQEGEDSVTAQKIEADRDKAVAHLEQKGLPIVDYKGLGESFMSRPDED